MSEFFMPLSGFRLVDVMYGDSLQTIAARELGDASRWIDLANINNLIPPYVTDDPDEASLKVVLSGGSILAPARTSPSANEGVTEEEICGTDICLVDGDLVEDDGDTLCVSGLDNLKQALTLRGATERGELMWHPTYGSSARSLIGTGVSKSSGILAAQYIKSALKDDYRVKSIESSKAFVGGDVVRVECYVVPVVGRSMKIEVNV